MSKIKVGGKEYKVLDNLGFQNGYYVKEVETETGKEMVVKDNGVWRFWDTKDRLVQPSRYQGM